MRAHRTVRSVFGQGPWLKLTFFPDERIEKIDEKADAFLEKSEKNKKTGLQTVRRLNAMEVQYKKNTIQCHFCNKEMATRWNYKRHLKGRW